MIAILLRPHVITISYAFRATDKYFDYQVLCSGPPTNKSTYICLPILAYLLNYKNLFIDITMVSKVFVISLYTA